MVKASIQKRAAAFVIENFILWWITFYPFWVMVTGLVLKENLITIIGLIAFVMVVTIYMIIQVKLWTMSTTIGKKIVGLKVVKIGSSMPATFSDMFIRECIGKFLSSFFMIGYIIAMVNDGVSLHDKMVDTVVIEDTTSIEKRD